MAELAFADNKDGSGGVFTVSSAASTEQIVVYASRFHGSNATRGFVNIGQRVGNGSVPFVGEEGCYSAHAVGVVGSTVNLSHPIAYRVSGGEKSVYEQVLEGVRDYVLSLSLPWVAQDPEKHIVAKMGSKLQELLKTANEAVYYLPTAESVSGEDNSYLSIEYPVNVIFYSKGFASLTRGLGDILKAREDLMTSMKKCYLPDVEAVHSVYVRPGPVINSSAYAQGMDVSTLTLVAVGELVDGLL